MHRHPIGWIVLEEGGGPVDHVAVDISDLQFGQGGAQGGLWVGKIVHPELCNHEEVFSRDFPLRDDPTDGLANQRFIRVNLCAVEEPVATLSDRLIEHLRVLRLIDQFIRAQPNRRHDLA
eukprot:CAMPEP_0185571568 /NCGR_PEP_ID=MMETSP0434-20130131/3610_1 /TAXON_ID=626734 ORGANISM="Favella taraikaensis, Strain Fe Narragansett Bay" /NCGR_SAMPLE_ID=MMETSP0434 /ASSEMBLY_ACC=CAM_ASM_000379 /LENGTH=119 /DNA_ID=CAMNT_0028187067 /DNA_START=517 /DNA_END=876 /DNA_ORIENTATION=-